MSRECPRSYNDGESKTRRVPVMPPSVGYALMVTMFCLSCAGPQPLHLAILGPDEEAYVKALNAFNGDARAGFAHWMARARNTTDAEVLRTDAEISTKRNPFDAHHDPRSVSRGAVIYKIHCARCHGDDARGQGPATLPDHPANDFKTFGSRFAATLHRGAPRKWFRVIRDGEGDMVNYPDERTSAMPPFGDKLTREQIWLVITYLQSLDMYLEPRGTQPSGSQTHRNRNAHERRNVSSTSENGIEVSGARGLPPRLSDGKNPLWLTPCTPVVLIPRRCP